MVKIFSVNQQVMAVLPPPPPPPPPPAPNPCCVATGSQVLMSEGYTISIEDIRPGDKVVTLQGIRTVRSVHRTFLGTGRTMMKIGNLRVSDDHDLWLDTNEWGTFNYRFWEFDAKWSNTLDVPAKKLDRSGPVTVACFHGFCEVVPQFEVANVAEIIWNLEIEDGGSFIADGYVVIANDCRPEHIEGVEWQGVSSLPGYSDPVQTTYNFSSTST